uniref:DUF4283 domain-containing protein n=1 Tax=Brassica oleracea var. oleracea TaxID=109376 RepID=A0A0D3AMS7_BRAOL
MRDTTVYSVTDDIDDLTYSKLLTESSTGLSLLSLAWRGAGALYSRMGSFQRNKSSHWIDIKGKGIMYDEDDEPIKLTDQDTPQNITEFQLSLIGKILNPKKQNVEKLLQKMPSQWGMEDRITANDLGNGKFLLNFTTEDDLNSVLRKGPFHFNFCMFVLVRWEPIVHDDYPWIIPFWTRLIGVPLHLWTVNNLKEIGARLGHVHQDQIELMEGRMLIDIDTRRPLKFARKAESPEGDEKIHSGYEVRVWEDPWIPTRPARPAIPVAPVMNPNMRVSDLINQDSKEWEEGTLENYVHPGDIPLIRSMAISSTHRQDSFCWEYTRNGHYTVKSGYWVAQNLLKPDEEKLIVEPSITKLQAFAWKLKAPRKFPFT